MNMSQGRILSQPRSPSPPSKIRVPGWPKIGVTKTGNDDISTNLTPILPIKKQIIRDAPSGRSTTCIWGFYTSLGYSNNMNSLCARALKSVAPNILTVVQLHYVNLTATTSKIRTPGPKNRYSPHKLTVESKDQPWLYAWKPKATGLHLVGHV